MPNRSYASELESAANRITEISRADLQIMLRRAALRLRNTAQVPIDPEWENALQCIAAEMNIDRSDLIRMIIKEWLEANAFLPVHMLEEDAEVEGRA
ncbi:hypothetical protein [Pseudaminobacter sp. NGMCC 1.201702]|uniref:hypothetical protein n=1 Tax=Pseudaminobacter sp. NGMCC 1.201702 TaxID=3391825 RepID=UPI0039F1000E